MPPTLMIMQYATSLFKLNQPDISVEIVLGFDGEDLVMSGCDTGARVQDMFGDWDYEYVLKVRLAQLPMLYGHFNVAVGDATGLVFAISQVFQGNYAYSSFRKFLGEHAVPYEAFSF